VTAGGSRIRGGSVPLPAGYGIFPISVENIYSNNVLGGVCRFRKEGQTGEDVLQDIFDLSSRHCGNPLCDICWKPVHPLLLPVMFEPDYLQRHFPLFQKHILSSGPSTI
jgi:hypothetical protein